MALKRVLFRAGLNNRGRGRRPSTSTTEWLSPAAMATAFESPGMSHCAFKLLPQAATDPSALSAKLCPPPPATATTPLRFDGGLHWLCELSPQTTTDPSFFTARL